MCRSTTARIDTPRITSIHGSRLPASSVDAISLAVSAAGGHQDARPEVAACTRDHRTSNQTLHRVAKGVHVIVDLIPPPVRVECRRIEARSARAISVRTSRFTDQQTGRRSQRRCDRRACRGLRSTVVRFNRTAVTGAFQVIGAR